MEGLSKMNYQNNYVPNMPLVHSNYRQLKIFEKCQTTYLCNVKHYADMRERDRKREQLPSIVYIAWIFRYKTIDNELMFHMKNKPSSNLGT